LKPSKLLPCPFWNRKNEPAFNFCLRESAAKKTVGSVLLDSDVAQIYGVETRGINKAVNNNPDKFPAGYVVELLKQQKSELVENFYRFNKMRNIFARFAQNELKFMPMDVAADKTLSVLSTTVPMSTLSPRRLRATEKNYPTGLTGLCRISFSSGKR
jgi:hypothetical protein